jgi:hypothetical protein
MSKPNVYRVLVNRARDHLTECPGLDPQVRQYLDFILYRVNNDNELFWHTQAALARRWNWSVTRIRRVHRVAIDVGAIEVIHKSDKAARKAGNLKQHPARDLEHRNFIRPILSWSGFTEAGVSSEQVAYIRKVLSGRGPRRIESPLAGVHDSVAGDTVNGVAGDTQTSPVSSSKKPQPPGDLRGEVAFHAKQRANQPTGGAPPVNRYSTLDKFIDRWNQIATHTAVKPITPRMQPAILTRWCPRIDEYWQLVLDGLCACPFWLGKAKPGAYKPGESTGLNPNALFSVDEQGIAIWERLATRTRFVFSQTIEDRIPFVLREATSADDVEACLVHTFAPYELDRARELAAEYLAITIQREKDYQASQSTRARLGRLLKLLKTTPEDLAYTLDLICDELTYLEADGQTLKDPTPWIDYTRPYLSSEHPLSVRVAAQRLHKRLRDLPAPPPLPGSTGVASPSDPPPKHPDPDRTR